MKDKLIEIIKNRTSLDDIKDQLKVDDRKILSLKKEIEMSGYILKKRYYSDGLIKYKLSHGRLSLYEEALSYFKIYNYNNKKFRSLFISDTHFGNKLDNITYIDQIYEYALKNNIHSIIHLGDFIQGCHNQDYTNYNECIKQLYYALENYPKENNINTYLLLGNHDLDSYILEGVSLIPLIENERLDIIPIGFAKKLLRIDQTDILLTHPLKNKEYFDEKADIIFRGHGHVYRQKYIDDTLKIWVPPLCDITYKDSPRKLDSIPGALDITFSKDVECKAKYDFLQLRHLIFNEKLQKLSEQEIKLSKTR